VGVAWVALWPAFHQTRKYSFLMISQKLLDISPFFLLIFSPLETADFLMLLRLKGDGYSLLCSKKQPPRHSATRFSTCGFFYESVSPKPLSTPLAPFQIFSNLFAVQSAPPVSLTPLANNT
jgi:hypothetical protein